MLKTMLGRTMESKPFRNSLIERRNFSVDSDTNPKAQWQALTLAQRFSASSLTKYGYELSFIRYSKKGSTAVLVLPNGTSATISEDGDIDTASELHIRQ